MATIASPVAVHACGTASTKHAPLDGLTLLRSKTQVDLDCWDVNDAVALGPFADCTSNQWETFLQLSNAKNAALVKDAVRYAQSHLPEFPDAGIDELGVEVAMVMFASRMLPYMTGAIHIMANPVYADDTLKTVGAAQRISRLCTMLIPRFESSRLVIKIASTWEGLQASAQLRTLGIQSLGTTLFTIEQAMLAGEAGCVSVSPFAYELRTFADPTFVDANPNFALFREIQDYYSARGIRTRVKGCAFAAATEALVLAGTDALTIMPDTLYALQSLPSSIPDIERVSIFSSPAKITVPTTSPVSYIGDRELFVRDLAAAHGGQASRKLRDAIDIFVGFQKQAEALVRGVAMGIAV